MNSRDVAVKVVDQANVDELGLDPSTMIDLLFIVLPELIDCFRNNDQLNEREIQGRMRQLHARDPKRLLRRVAANLRWHSRREARKQNNSKLRLNMAQSYALATSLINETVTAEPDKVDDVVFKVVTIES
jgi:hypothetical protein